MDKLIDLLHSGRHSLVVGRERTANDENMPDGENVASDIEAMGGIDKTASGLEIRTFDGRGVQDLYRLLKEHPSWLNGALVADKVVGKGAAALMVLGKVQEVFADLISTPALTLLREAGTKVRFNQEVPYIINRQNSGPCPVETLCQPCATAEECWPKIEAFVSRCTG